MKDACEQAGDMIYHTWFCLNRNCLHEFITDDGIDNPPCPWCQGEKTQWIPQTTGTISSKTRETDTIVKELKEAYGDKNYRSPAAGQPVIPRPAVVPVPGRSRPFSPAPGWGMDLPLTAQGQVHGSSYCAPVSPAALPPVLLDTPKVIQKVAGPKPQVEAAHKARIPR